LHDRLLAERSVEALAETFRLLGDPTRIRILDVLSKSELCVCDIAALLKLTDSAVSHQLRLLRSMRVVRSRRSGRRIFYALDDPHIVGLFGQGLEHVQEPSGPGPAGIEATPAPASRDVAAPVTRTTTTPVR